MHKESTIEKPCIITVRLTWRKIIADSITYDALNPVLINPDLDPKSLNNRGKGGGSEGGEKDRMESKVGAGVNNEMSASASPTLPHS